MRLSNLKHTSLIVCDEAKAKEHERYDLHAEHNWEREQDMLADAREAEYDDREIDDLDGGWY